MTSSGDSIIYAGKWTNEEADYVDCLIKNFEKGNLELPEGATLRKYLAKMIGCRVKRISKRYESSGYNGRQKYSRNHDVDPVDSARMTKELKHLRVTFLESRKTILRFNNRTRSTASQAVAAARNQRLGQNTPSHPFNGVDGVSHGRTIHSTLLSASSVLPIPSGQPAIPNEVLLLLRGIRLAPSLPNNLQQLRTSSSLGVSSSTTPSFLTPTSAATAATTTSSVSHMSGHLEMQLALVQRRLQGEVAAAQQQHLRRELVRSILCAVATSTGSGAGAAMGHNP
ncbi:RING [Seminavis robusta]|uniref:RING n=1 Tax=Seminavis robusta TaxID=568900 RepID=A0A9N8DRV6_9STRA|nr:RING [Seminavis robusta]|eukprot:Sro296_g110730.1 RING (283) ;mRNA; f:62014-62862